MTSLEQILTKAEPIIDKIVEADKKWYTDNDKKYTEFAEKCTRLRAEYKLGNSIHKYLTNNDILEKIDINSKIGLLTCDIVFVRDNERHYLMTSLIIAGGHNIQCIHYRYIAKCTAKNISKSLDISYLNDIKNKLKSLTVQQKIEKEIDKYQTLLTITHGKIKNRENLTIDEIVKNSDAVYGRILSTTFDEHMSNESYNSKVYNTPEKFEQYKETIKNELIEQNDRWLQSYKRDEKRYNAKIEKLLQKLKPTAL